MNKNATLIDGMARNAACPKTFRIPRPEEVAAVSPGHYVKIGVEYVGGGERFWLRVTKVDGKTITGIVEQADMVYTRRHGVRHGDRLTCEPRHVLGIYAPVAGKN